jgi:hypothetical protein
MADTDTITPEVSALYDAQEAICATVGESARDLDLPERKEGT